ncbi:MAG TPA: ornithine cyclodeaminase family protein [Terriglobales bacterium]|jgi:ornithine cyclodeaminase/alanine dehydrogenase-like protein (mu-crystallin family)|nr:ornithine cyclodeaminase family protein [Terriglobales bacterium]
MFTCTDAELEALLDPAQVIAAIRAAFAGGFEKVSMPQRLHLETETGTLLIMPCATADDDVFGLKIVSVSRKSRPEGRVRASYMLLDAKTSRTIAVLEANYLTDLRTAATTVIASEILVRPDAVTLGVFGTGRQAEAHLTMLSLLRRFRRILVSGTSATKTDAFAQRMQEQCGCDIEATDAETCAASSDVICTCTSSAQPLFRGDLIRPGTHLNLIGTFQAHAREVDSVLIRSARVFVDTYEAALAEAGDILLPLRAAEIGREHVLGDLHELVTGEKLGRASSEDITVFKSVGCALEDLVTAKLALRAIESRAEATEESATS